MGEPIVNRIRNFAPVALRYLGYTNYLLLAIAVIVIAGLMFSVVYQSLMRYAIHGPTSWVYELAQYAMVFVIFLPLARVEQLGQHIRVEAITSRMSPKMSRRANIVALSLSLIFVAIYFWSSVCYAYDAFSLGWNSGPYKLGLDQWPILAVIPIGLLLLWLNLLVSLIWSISKHLPEQQITVNQEQTASQSTSGE